MKNNPNQLPYRPAKPLTGIHQRRIQPKTMVTGDKPIPLSEVGRYPVHGRRR